MSTTLDSNLKKLLVYVNFTSLENDTDGTQLVTLKNQIKTQSAADFKDRVFFIANDGTIISHGVEFGTSEAIKERIKTLETKATNLETVTKALTGLENVPADAAQVSISNDSVIGVYVNKQILANKSVVAPKENSGITVETSEDAAGTTTYTIGLDQTAIVDDKTIVTENGKLKTAVKLVKKYATVETPDANSTFYDDKAGIPAGQTGHPVILLTDKDGAILDVVDGNEFVTDGMLDTVEYNEVDGTLTFTWNTDGKKNATVIDVKKLFHIEGIHTTTPDYIDVKQENAPFDGTSSDAENPAVANQVEYHVSAKVDATDLTAFSSVSHVAEVKGDDGNVTTPESYATNYANVDAEANAVAAVSGLVDAKKVAAKLIDIDKAIAGVGNDALAREKSLTAGIDEKLKALCDDLDAEVDRAKAAEKVNADAIAILNGDDTTAGSVAKAIKDLKESLDSEVTYKDEHDLVKVAVSQVDGVLASKENAVEVKTASLISATDQDPEYVVGSTNYKVKSLDDVRKEDPSLTTSQDVWVFGQCIKSQALKEINSDSNEYIKIVREAKSDADPTIVTKVAFEPWLEIHAMNELK